MCLCIDVCQGVTCSGQGTCQVIGNAPTCQCDSGFAGANCQTSKYFSRNSLF